MLQDGVLCSKGSDGEITAGDTAENWKDGVSSFPSKSPVLCLLYRRRQGQKPGLVPGRYNDEGEWEPRCQYHGLKREAMSWKDCKYCSYQVWVTIVSP